MSYIENIIEDKLLNLHTAYVAKVLSYSEGKATVQPLNLIKQYGKTAQAPAIVKNIPVVNSARYKLNTTTIEGVAVLTPIEISKGDLVFCVCADRDISQALKGNMSTPALGHHSRSDSVVIGIL